MAVKFVFAWKVKQYESMMHISYVSDSYLVEMFIVTFC